MIMMTKKCIELHSEYLNELVVLFTFFFGFFLFLSSVFVLSYISRKYKQCGCVSKIKELSEKQEDIVSTLFLSNSMVVRNIANERSSDNSRIMDTLDSIKQQLSE